MGHWKDKYVIGVTGNIATGKSLVRKMLQHLGAYTVDADELTHQVMAPNAPAFKPVIEWFGKWIVSADGRIDRNRLGTVAFAHPVALQRLEAITHPIIGEAIDALVKRSQHKIVVIEAIKLLEGDLAGKVDAVWVVDAHPKIQLQRLMEKRGLSQEEAVRRIRVQSPQSEKIAGASVVITNNGDPNQVWAQVQAQWDKITKISAPAPVAPPTPVAATPAPTPAPTQARPVAATPTPSTAAPTPTPTAPPVAVPAVGGDIGNIVARRAVRSDLDKLADLFNKTKGTNLTPGDIILTFAETSYLVAESNGKMLGSVGFVVENLITQSSDIILLPDVPAEKVLPSLITEMENAAKSLESEIAFIYLNEQRDANIIQILKNAVGFETTVIEDLNFTAWREAVRSSQPPNTIILKKQLREGRHTVPF